MNTILLLERLAALVHQSVRDDAAAHGLQPIHVQILGYLARANRYSDFPIAIAEYFGMTRGTVSQSLTVLERKGLVKRQPDPRHGRRVHLELTAAGRAILESSWSRKVESALAAEGVNTDALGGLLQQLLLGLQRQNAQRPFGICRQCAHFLTEDSGKRCGLTGEPLAHEQTERICREWAKRSATG